MVDVPRVFGAQEQQVVAQEEVQAVRRDAGLHVVGVSGQGDGAPPAFLPFPLDFQGGVGGCEQPGEFLRE